MLLSFREIIIDNIHSDTKLRLIIIDNIHSDTRIVVKWTLYGFSCGWIEYTGLEGAFRFSNLWIRCTVNF